jgi:hypothetical protein
MRTLKNGELRVGVIHDRPPTKTRVRPDGTRLPEGNFITTLHYKTFATRAEAQRYCDECKAKQTDPRYDYQPEKRSTLDAHPDSCRTARAFGLA